MTIEGTVRRIGRSGALVVLVTSGLLIASNTVCATAVRERSASDLFTSEFRLGDCTFLSEGDDNPYFPLTIWHQLVLIGEQAEEEVEVQFTVLDETEKISLPDRDSIETRVVEKRVWADGELVEISRHFFAICVETGDVFRFGADVDQFDDGEIAGHDGAWRVGESGATPGIIMPGSFLLGSRYFQEIAPDVAMDRGENQEIGLTVSVPAGIFLDCVSVQETTPLDRTENRLKTYAPGVGLIADDSLKLVEWFTIP